MGMCAYGEYVQESSSVYMCICVGELSKCVCKPICV